MVFLSELSIFSAAPEYLANAINTDSNPRSRFPTVKVVVGHLGERIPSDLWRIDESKSPDAEAFSLLMC